MFAVPNQDVKVSSPEADDVLKRTRRWISSVVIGLNLCPFASRVFRGELIRYVVSDAADEEELLTTLGDELRLLGTTPIAQIETTLIIHPRALTDFLEFNDFLAIANRLLRALGYEGVIQLAHFHPHYQFEGTQPDDIENDTNRSPYPTLHLLREESISNITATEEELLAIPERNIAFLKSLGRDELRRRVEGDKD
jgi:hypothetical protein